MSDQPVPNHVLFLTAHGIARLSVALPHAALLAEELPRVAGLELAALYQPAALHRWKFSGSGWSPLRQAALAWHYS